MIGKAKAQFPKSKSVGFREWGEESLLVLASKKYSMKRISIKAGRKGGLQFHRLKDEAGYIVYGKMKIRFETDDGSLTERIVSEGEWFHFPAGCIHQEEAITDVMLIEVSTPHFNDRVRVESQFGLEESFSLPTTSVEEIKEL